MEKLRQGQRDKRDKSRKVRQRNTARGRVTVTNSLQFNQHRLLPPALTTVSSQGNNKQHFWLYELRQHPNHPFTVSEHLISSDRHLQSPPAEIISLISAQSVIVPTVNYSTLDFWLAGDQCTFPLVVLLRSRFPSDSSSVINSGDDDSVFVNGFHRGYLQPKVMLNNRRGDRQCVDTAARDSLRKTMPVSTGVFIINSR